MNVMDTRLFGMDVVRCDEEGVGGGGDVGGDA